MEVSQSLLSPQEVTELREQAEKSLYFFAKGVLGLDWLDPEIHGPLCEVLEQERHTRLKFVLPRGWLKTSLCSQAYPIWRACKNPSLRVLLCQNTYKNAVAKLKPIKFAFDHNALLKMLFPEVLPDSSCTWTADSLCLKRPKAFNESTFEAAGVRTQVTSRHYDIIIEDDTVAPDYDELGGEGLCPTKDDIEQAIGWHRLVPPLLTDMRKGQNLVVGTRWFERDLLSWIDENEPQFVGYTRACRENEKGEPDEQGRVVYPKRFDDEVLKQLEATMGPYLFSTLYMNKPIRSSDMVFQPEWFRFYDTTPVLERLAIFTTVDLAGDPEQTKTKGDYNVVMTTGKDRTTGVVYILQYFRKHCNPGELIDAIFDHVRRWRPIRVGIEAIAYQGTLSYWVRERMRKENMHFFCEGFTHGKKAKNVRIMGLQPLIANGTVMMRRTMGELQTEMQAFPFGANDDLIDALASQLPLWGRVGKMDEEKAEATAGHPFSFETAVAELRGKAEEDEIEKLMTVA